MKMEKFVKLMTGHFDNREQFTEMKSAGKLFPYARHVNTVCNDKINNIPENFTGIFMVEESYYETDGKCHASPHLFLITDCDGGIRMIQKNPYAAYNNSKIQTATPAELTLLLYEGAIKFTNIAIVAIEKGDIEKAHNNIRKAENIIREFQITLDHKYAVAKDFDAVYTYLLQRLLEANMKKDKDILEEVLGHLRTMRDTWKEVMAKTANGNNIKTKEPVA